MQPPTLPERVFHATVVTLFCLFFVGAALVAVFPGTFREPAVNALAFAIARVIMPAVVGLIEFFLDAERAVSSLSTA